MSKISVKVDSDLIAEYKLLFEQCSGYKPTMSRVMDKLMKDEIERLKKELSKKKK